MLSTKLDITIQKATRKDLNVILFFIKELANYEGKQDLVKTTIENLDYYLFTDKKADVLIVKSQEKHIAFALYYYTFSTFNCKPNIYLEDLFVLEEYRGHGIGSLLFKELERLAIETNCGRIEWSCLSWNKPSLDFYLSKKAKIKDEWTYLYLDTFNK